MDSDSTDPDAAPGDAATPDASSDDGSAGSAAAADSTQAPLSADAPSADPSVILTGGKTNLSWAITGEFDTVVLRAAVRQGDAPADQDVTQQTQDGGGVVAALEVSPPDGVVSYSLAVTPKGGGAEIDSSACTVHVVPLPSFDAAATGLRRHGNNKGSASLTAPAGQVIEAYWSVQNGNLIQDQARRQQCRRYATSPMARARCPSPA